MHINIESHLKTTVILISKYSYTTTKNFDKWNNDRFSADVTQKKICWEFEIILQVKLVW